MGCQPLDGRYEAFLLGTASADCAQAIAAHLDKSCPQCLAHLQEASRLLYFLLMNQAKPAKLSPKLKARLLANLRRR
jgi:hypothetical protein